MGRDKAYSKPAGTKVCDFECEVHKHCPAPKDNKCRQYWEKTKAEKKMADILVIFRD